jgi:hypothetical protein
VSGGEATLTAHAALFAVEEQMSSSHFIVYLRDAAWQYSHRGTAVGPFGNREEAIDVAIKAARESDDPEAEVIVQDPETRTETVWRGEASPGDQVATPSE